MSSIFSWRTGSLSLLFASFSCGLASGEMFLLPSTFEPSVGERITVQVHSSGGRVPQLADSGIYTKQAAYSLVNARKEGHVLVLECGVKASGISILAAESKPYLEGNVRHVEFAKAILCAGKADENASMRMGAALEITPADTPRLGLNRFLLWLQGQRVPPSMELSNGSWKQQKADGAFEIKVPGKYTLTASHSAQGVQFSTSLVFEIR